MKKSIVLILLLLISTCFLLGQVSSNENYIKLTYGGPRADMYIPDVAFSTKPLSPDLYFGLFIKLRKKDLTAVRKAIETSKEVKQIDTTKTGYFLFSVVTDKKTTLYKAINPDKVNSVFKSIVQQISKPSQKKRVSEILAIVYEKMLNPY